MLHGNVRTFDVIFKKRWGKKAQGRLSWRWWVIACLFLVRNTKFDVIFKKIGEESTRAAELALEGHSLFISS